MNNVLNEEILKELKNKIKGSGGCNLVVGTGINNRLTPVWTKLIESIINYILESKLHYLNKKDRNELLKLFMKEDVYTQALIIKHYLGKKEYIMLIRDEIYKNHDQYNKNIEESLIPQISDFCKSNLVKSIISVNYDDYLESYLSSEDVKFTSIYNFEKIKSIKKNVIPIYHIHGYIDRKHTFSELFNQKITFSIDEYFNLFNNPFIWQNIMPIYNFMLYPSIFLGTSLDDINLMRIVELSDQDKEKPNAYWFKAYHDGESAKAMSFIAKFKGINYINCGKPEKGRSQYLMINKVIGKLISDLKRKEKNNEN